MPSMLSMMRRALQMRMRSLASVNWPLRVVVLLLLLAAPIRSHALGLSRVRFVVVDAKTHKPISGARVVIEDSGGSRQPLNLLTGVLLPAPTSDVNLQAWC